MQRGIYRIIDANFNRAREAIRVVEDYCRFVLNCEPLSGRAKQLRHELSAAINELGLAELIAARDTLGDVGVGQRIDNQLSRQDIKDCFVADSKRFTEALRVLSETSNAINPSISGRIEKLRYGFYTLEKDIVVFAEPAEKFKKVRLYVIITSDSPSEILALVNQCAAGGADCVQLRSKNLPDDELFDVSSKFVKACSDCGVLSIVNDRADIAIAAGGDGVHLGQGDLPIEQVRGLQLRPLIIGKSTHTLEQLKRACDELCTYVALGPVFSTLTKPGLEPVGVDYVKQAVEVLENTAIGHVAIGGITKDNVGKVLKAGARTIAVCSAVTAANSPARACRELREIIANYFSI